MKNAEWIAVSFGEKKSNSYCTCLVLCVVILNIFQIASEACIPFWPKAKEDVDRVVELRIANTIEITSSFSYLKIRTHTLKLYNSVSIVPN